jgi:hypothetical protein
MRLRPGVPMQRRNHAWALIRRQEPFLGRFSTGETVFCACLYQLPQASSLLSAYKSHTIKSIAIDTTKKLSNYPSCALRSHAI